MSALSNRCWGLLVWLICWLLFAVAALGRDSERVTQPTVICPECDEASAMGDHAFLWPDECPHCGYPLTFEVFDG